MRLTQAKLIAKINSLTELPHAILLIGEEGSEQEKIYDLICKKFCLDKLNITENFSKDLVDSINDSHVPALYILDNIDVRKQNIMLKLFEEPSPYAYILLSFNSIAQVLETIKTRSYMLELEHYKPEDLKPLIERNEELTLQLCSTPGQVEIANRTNLEMLCKYVDGLVNSLDSMNYGLAINVSAKINFSDEYDKYDLRLFTRALKCSIIKKGLVDAYHIINDIDNNIYSQAYKKKYFDNCMSRLWRLFN